MNSVIKFYTLFGMPLALASPTPFINPTNIVNVFPAARFTDIGTLLNIIVPLLTIGAALFLGYKLLTAAYTIITAGAEAEKIDQAKNTATYSVIGIIVILCAYLVVKLIGFMLNVEIPL